MKIFKVPILERNEIAKDVIEVIFDLAQQDFSFLPGQYIRITIPELLFPDPRGNYRDFSIVSSPHQTRTLTIAMRASESGFKKTLMTMPIGSDIQITGPHGEFTLPLNPNRPVVYIAGGIGITPFMSHFQFALEEKIPTEIILLYGYTSKESAPYIADLKRITKENHHFSFEEIVGAVEEKHIHQRIMSVMEITTPIWFLAGPPAMLSALRKILFALGVAEEAIHTEEFLGYEPGTSIPSQAISRRAQKNEDVVKLQIARAETLLDALSKIALISEDDIEGTITFANDKFVEIAKYKREEIMGQNHRILKSGYHTPEFFKEMWATISSGRVWHGEVKNMAKDGTFYWVDSVIAPVTGADGRPVSYLSVRFPITERKELEAIKAKDEAILASIGDGLVATDENGKILMVNKAFGTLLGWKLEEVKGRLFTDVVPVADEEGNILPDTRRPISNIFKQQTRIPGSELGSMKSEATTLYYKRKDGTYFPVGITVSPIMIGDRFAGAVEVFRDITKEKSVDRSKTEFVSLASHQLRTPLTTINWYSEILLKSGATRSAEKQKEYLQKIHAGSERMVNLVNTLLNVSRIELGTLPVTMQQVHVTDLLLEVLNEQKPQIDKQQIVVTTSFPKDIPKIQTDPNLLHIVFQNIVSNAIKYTPPNGWFDISVLQNDMSVLITFSDSGYGIPEKDQEKIFTKLFRSGNIKEKGVEGTGLGLYIVKSVLAALGGTIRLESEENKGTKFFVSLPLIQMRKGN